MLFGKDCGTKYTVKFRPSCVVFRLERKVARNVPATRRTTCFRYIVSAERLPEPMPMRCIAIDSPDHLYLAGEHFIPTHNTKAIVMDAFFRCMNWPKSHAYIFRRTYSELEDTVIKEAKESIPQELYNYNGGRHEMMFPNGSAIHFRHCATVSDMYNYKSVEIQWLYFDELTSFEFEIYDFIRSRLRAKKEAGIVPCTRSASNPGDIGHGWVRARFVDAAPYMTMVEHRITSQASGKVKIERSQYIPSLLTENPHISEDYIFQLESKPKALREALLYGHWDAFQGQVFTEFVDLTTKRAENKEEAHLFAEYLKAGQWTHVIKPFILDANWPRFMSFDHGFSKPFSVGWWSMDYSGRLYRYKEWYGSDGTPNVGTGLTPRQIVAGILAREKEEAADNIRIDRVADPSIFDRSRGDSVARQMEPTVDGKPGVYFTAGDNTRMAGKMQLHERLAFDPGTGKPMLYVFDTCRDFIRTIPALSYDQNKVEDVDTDGEDHCYDETRYLLMHQPMPSRRPVERVFAGFDPYRRIS